MKSHHLLSNDQHRYITSQKDVINPSEQRRRISSTIEQAFKTFDIILTNDGVPRTFVEELFNHERMRYFLDMLIRYDSESMIAEESNKQKIARDMIELGFRYFQSRYKQTNYLRKQIEDINSLLSELDFLSETQQQENEAMEMYRARSKMRTPPQIIPSKDFWIAQCIFCFNGAYGNNKTEGEAIQKIRHSKGCMFSKDVKRFSGRHKEMEIWRYIRTFAPRDLKKNLE